MRWLLLLVLLILPGCNLHPSLAGSIQATTQPAGTIKNNQNNANGQIAANLSTNKEQDSQSQGNHSPVITFNGSSWPLLAFLLFTTLIIGLPSLFRLLPARQPKQFVRIHRHI